MLESLVASLLNRFLGSYVENFDPKQLNIGIWSGDVKLKNLRLKKESLDRFKLPLDVKFGHLGQLTLQIPWSNLKSKPVKVTIEDVYLLASPIILTEYDEDEEKRRELILKKRKLEDLEIMNKSKPESSTLSDEDAAKNLTFTQNLVTKIVDNLQVTIKNIHVRYEDESVFTEEPYSFGFTLAELSAVSTDESWLPSFISGVAAHTNKLLTLNSFEIYWNTQLNSIFTEDTEEFLANFKEIIELSSTVNANTQYLLKPVSGTGHLTVNKLGATETTPHIKTELFFEEFGIDLDSEQYKDILWTASKYHWYLKTQQFRKLRPKKTVEEAPLEWFQYAAKSVLSEIHDKNYKWTWEYFKKRRDQRKAYVSLWKAKLVKPTLTLQEQLDLDQLEEELTFEDLRFYRSIANSERRKEKLEILQLSESSSASAEASSKKNQSGWLSSWWGGSKATAEADADDSLQMTDEQRKELYDAIEFDEQQSLVEAVNIPKDRVKMEVNATLKRGALMIRRSKDQKNLAEVIFEGCNAQFYQRPDSFLACFLLQEFKVEDGTESTLYKHIVSVEQLHSGAHSPISNEEEKPEPFFLVSFESNPLDGVADMALSAKLRSMTIFHNPQFIEDIAKFFKPPKIHLDTVGMIMSAAESTLEGLTTQTRIGLQYALEEHKTLNCKLDLQAPLVIIPLDPSDWSSPVAILDAGHISVFSDLADPKVIESVKNADSSTYSLGEWEKLNELMYDKFDLQLQDAQILIGNNIKSTIEQLHSESNKPALILDDLDIKFLLQISIMPTAYNLARFKVGADIPRFRASLSDYQYKVMMQLVEKAIPNFDFDDEDDDQPMAFAALHQGGADGLIDELSSDNESTISKTSVVNKDTSMKDKQHLFEFYFNIDFIQLTLLRCSDTTTLSSDPLVDLNGGHFHLDFYKTALDMGVDLVLSEISVEDYMVSSSDPEFTKLISTSASQPVSDSDKVEDLLRVKYTRTQRIVEFNQKEIEVFDQDIDVDFAAIKFVITRKSVLTLLNFILNTFTDPNPPEAPTDALRHNADDEETAPQKMNVNLNLESITMILNDDGIKLATIQLNKADVTVFMVPEKMKVAAKLGGFSLHDEVHDSTPLESVMRQLISIEGDELAEFVYETFDNTTNVNNYNSLVKFHAGSLKINFIEAPFTQIFGFLSRFQQMKYVYDSARAAALNQANNIEDANKMHFDVLIQTPIIVLPKFVDGDLTKYDSVTFNLGEIYLYNKFMEENSKNINFIEAGIRSTKIFSSFQFQDLNQYCEIISGLNIGFRINFLEQASVDRPTIIIDGNIEGSEIKLTEYQSAYLFQMLQSVSRVFSANGNQESLSELEDDAALANMALQNSNNTPEVEELPERQVGENEEEIPSDHSKIDFTFDASNLSLTLFNDTNNVEDISDKGLSNFSLRDTGIKFTMKEDGNYKAELHIKSFVVEDIRKLKDNKFTKIIPEIEHDSNQFMASLYSEGLEEKRYTYAMLSVDSPKTILALDYLFAVKTFADVAFKTDTSVVMTPQTSAISSQKDPSRVESSLSNSPLQIEDLKEPKVESGSFGFTINIVNSSVILLADPSAYDSEAIVFKVEQFLITSQNIISLSASNIGMFLCRMNQFDDNRLRIIDDFSASLTVDSRDSNSTTFLTQIEASVDKLLMRLSLRDIRLAMSIFNRASSLYSETIKGSQGEHAEEEDNFAFTKEFRNKLSQYAPTILSSISSTSRVSNLSNGQPVVVVKGESLLAEIQGFRLVLIGDVHELPVLDMNVNPFNVDVKNWSTDLEADTSLESYVNIFNYSTSSWEPLLEPWPISCHVAKIITDKKPSILVDFVSKQLAELTVSSRSIALLSQITSLLSDEEELKPRGENSPYIILNQTGYDVNVWIDNDSDEGQNFTTIKKDLQAPWHFEDWRAVRESLSTEKENGLLGIEIVGSPYQIVNKVSLKGEGEEVFMLKPPVANVHNRLSCEVKLNDEKVKVVVLRSTVTLQNNTLVPIIVKCDPIGNEVVEDYLRIEPGLTHALPIDAVHSRSFRIRPDIKTSYGWSKNQIFWKNIMDRPISLACPPLADDNDTEFFFQVDSKFDPDEALVKVYPHMKLTVSSPIEVENLLPFDISYRIYDKSYKKDWKNYLKKGSTSPIHIVTLEHLLLLSFQPNESGFDKSEFAIVNAPKESDFRVDTRVFMKHRNGQKLYVNLHYTKSHDSGAGVKVSIYAPYIILNRTGLDLALSENYNVMRSSAAVTTETRDENGEEQLVTKYPDMFSFEKPDRSNRAILRVGDSGTSEPISLDAIGQSYDLTVPVYAKQAEINVGIHIGEGEGVYKATKVITIAPRFIMRNSYNQEIQIKEVGSSKEYTLQPGESYPLYNLRRYKTKQFMLRFLGAESQWSSPFNVTDIGQIHVKILKKDVGHILLKARILLENATIFIDLSDAKNQWPFSIRNFSDEEIIFYQSDPNLDENGVEIVANQPPFKPIYYRLPQKSVMPYSWDYPAGNIKELIIRSHGRERHIQLAEIGNLRPMRLPATATREAAIIDLNVVADGPTQTLVITNYDPSTSLYQLKTQQTNSTMSLTQGGENFETIEKDENYYSKILVRLEGLGISLINYELQELCYITFKGMELRYNESDIYQNYSVKLKWIQIDNQLFGSIFPMVLYPSVLPQSLKEMNNHPTFSGSISKVKDDTHGVLFVKYATVLLQEIAVEIDEDFLFAVIDFAKIPGASWNKAVIDKLWDENLKLPEPTYIDSSEDVYFEALHFQPMQMNLSFVRTDRISDEEIASSGNPVLFFLNVLTMAIGNINDAPVRLNALLIENVKVPIPVLMQMVQAHYGQAFLYQVHKILGSADFLGNPVGLFNNISSGFMDIFYEPYQGFIMNDRPQELGIGIAKGGISFLKKSAFGVSDSVAKFTGSMAKGLTAATLDKDFQERRRLNQRRNKPNQALYNFSNGASSFVDSISSGITGIATAPIQGSREGAGGFIKGLGKGLFGLPTKTAIGIFDLASNVSEGIRSSTTAFDKAGLEKIRLPRYILHDKIIRPFSEREAQGQYWLKVVDGGVYFNQRYLAHVVLPGEENVVIVSFEQIMLCSIVTLTSKWRIDYGDIRSISLENTGLKIIVKTREGNGGPFIPLGDASARKFLYSKIGVAVGEYNNRCRAII